MKVLQINSVCGIRSTGRICTDIAKTLEQNGHECKIAYGREKVPSEYKSIAIRIGNQFDIYFNAIKARFFDNEGFNAKISTKIFLKQAEEYDPDIVWIHNLHGYYINIEMLFDWIKSRPKMQVMWTLHDCWAFTGHCSHFSYIGCDKWKEGCRDCPQKNKYPSSIYYDRSQKNYYLKMKIFCNVNNMTIITPSQWLSDLVSKSFLSEYPINVVHNSVDCSTFKPTDSDFREKYNLVNKKVVLGVATSWSEKKGLLDFIKLSKLLGDDFKIVLVGLTKKQAKKIPRDILCIPRTNNVNELAKWYSIADVFVNPSKEETFGLTTLEAIYCGTNAIVYKDTACEEVARAYGGLVVEQNIEALYKEVQNICNLNKKTDIL